VLQCVAVCCSMLQCVVVCFSGLQWVAVRCRVVQSSNTNNLPPQVGVSQSVQCVAACCSVLQCIAAIKHEYFASSSCSVGVCCN